MKAATPVRMGEIRPFALRMQPELRALVDKAAAENDRPVNTEIVAILEYHLEAGALPPERKLEVGAISEAVTEALKPILAAVKSNVSAERDRFSAITKSLASIETLVSASFTTAPARDGVIERAPREGSRQVTPRLERSASTEAPAPIAGLIRIAELDGLFSAHRKYRNAQYTSGEGAARKSLDDALARLAQRFAR